ncbi:MAG: GTPase HflX [Candidatus Bathyarchaeota archaeon]|nr:MAG: GTPase HflX [Candidatus Bathyarchaeota archaeon]
MQRRLRSEPSSLDELQSLAESAGYAVTDSLEQITEPNPRYQIGLGKAKELAELIAENKIEKTIFDNELKPVQAYNLAKETGVEAIDRFQLILEIFAKRASTLEAKLQIQLAKLQYELPRAKEKVRLARMSEQPGFRGLGQYEIDVYYETVKREISGIREKLRKIRIKRQLHRTRRVELGFSSVSLAGYTNAGKSSLFNALAEVAVPVDTGLFTTLSTTTRVIEFSNRKVLLTDTVGFIDRLPLTLIEAFQSTLEEAIFSDLILLVVDASETADVIESKLSCCLDTIQKIGATQVPIITVLNKIDLLSPDEVRSRTETLKGVTPKSVPISALYKTNTQLLKQEILLHLGECVQTSFSLPVTDETMSFLSWLHKHSDVHQVEYEGDKMNVVFESIPWFAEKVRGKVEELGGVFSL